MSLVAYLSGVATVLAVEHVRRRQFWDEKIFWISYVVNAVSRGTWGETLCSRVGRNILTPAPCPLWIYLAGALDWLFSEKESNHCVASYLRHLRRTRAPRDDHQYLF